MHFVASWFSCCMGYGTKIFFFSEFNNVVLPAPDGDENINKIPSVLMDINELLIALLSINLIASPTVKIFQPHQKSQIQILPQKP